jgi:muramoyltetrapeptide carboxypeptidase
MIIPNNLKDGDSIGLISISRSISPNELSASQILLKSWGLKVVLAKNIFKKHNQFSGTDIERSKAFQELIDSDLIKAIFFVRGGYGAVRVIDKIDFTNLLKQPKWLIGYSDITVIHSHIHFLGLSSLHASMPINFPNNTKGALDSIHNCLFKSESKIQYITSKQQAISPIKSEIVGGNLSIIYSLLGSFSDIQTDNKILFLEDLDEYLYHIDRMVIALKRNGKLQNLKALIIGSMINMHDNKVPFGLTAKEIILEHTKDSNYPVIFDFPAGHIDDNNSIILGKESILKIDNNSVTLLQ